MVTYILPYLRKGNLCLYEAFTNSQIVSRLFMTVQAHYMHTSCASTFKTGSLDRAIHMECIYAHAALWLSSFTTDDLLVSGALVSLPVQNTHQTQRPSLSC